MPKRIPEKTIEKILELNSEGKTNLEISSVLLLKTDTINKYLKLYGRKSNKRSQKSLHNIVDLNKAICSDCKQEKLLTQFQYGRKGKPDEYRFSYCNECRNKRTKARLQTDLKSWINAKLGRIRRASSTTNLDVEYIINLLTKQNGKCFYSGYDLVFGKRRGLCPNSLSIDKVIPELGYVKGNVVLCSTRINTMKSNATLEEMKEWMPKWYQKLKDAEFVTVLN